MKTTILGLLAVGLLAGTSVPLPAQASIIYHFDFTNLTGVTGGTGADFSITLVYDTYVVTTGMAPLAGAPQPTTLGYAVAYAGTNQLGYWGFDDNGLSVMDDGFLFMGRSFLFDAPGPPSGYFSAPGTFIGDVHGNAPHHFSGSAVLTITDTSVPEPGSLALLGMGLFGLGLTRRRTA